MKITFVPVGGLANRMRVMAYAVHLSQETNCQLNVLWFKDWALNAPFSCLFEPINDKIEKHCSLFEKNTIGVHIRRTDNIASIEQSPLELFYKKLDIDIEIHDNTFIYLATDSEEVKAQMRQRYGRRIICSENEASRNSIEGIQEGVVDMYTLAQTKKSMDRMVVRFQIWRHRLMVDHWKS